MSETALTTASNGKMIFSRLGATLEDIAGFCQRWHIIEFSLFGSVLRDDFSSESDIDVLIEFEPDCVLGLEFVSMADELESMFGRPVDVLTRSAVERSENYIRRKSILESTELVYATK